MLPVILFCLALTVQEETVQIEKDRMKSGGMYEYGATWSCRRTVPCCFLCWLPSSVGKSTFSELSVAFSMAVVNSTFRNINVILSFDILFFLMAGCWIHGKVPTRNWVKGSKNIMKSLLGSCLYVSSGISLNFLFYFNFHVSKLVQNKRGKKSVSWDWLYFWWLQKGSLCSKTAQFSLWVPPDEEECLPEAETSSLPPMHVVSRAS